MHKIFLPFKTLSWIILNRNSYITKGKIKNTENITMKEGKRYSPEKVVTQEIASMGKRRKNEKKIERHTRLLTK